jgi:hypothetical protein
MLLELPIWQELHPEDAKDQNNGRSVTAISNSVKQKVSYA